MGDGQLKHSSYRLSVPPSKMTVGLVTIVPVLADVARSANVRLVGTPVGLPQSSCSVTGHSEGTAMLSPANVAVCQDDGTVGGVPVARATALGEYVRVCSMREFRLSATSLILTPRLGKSASVDAFSLGRPSGK